MHVIVFAGPSLRGESLTRHKTICWKGPAARGDIYEAVKQKPLAIGLVDGLFENTPSVSHKELLWALAQGVHVLGAGSMGAIRAAELDTYGMRGIGKVYVRFKEENLDDDEVAVLHAPPELGYFPTTIAMVNVRFTLERARAQGLITAADEQALLKTAKSMFYKDRSWGNVFEKARRETAIASDLAGLKAWLPGGYVDQKKEDAIELVTEIARLAHSTDRFQPAFEFRKTQDWEAIVREWEAL